MSLILDSKYVGENSYKMFITNRFLRIYPVYWVVLILTILISIFSGLLRHNWIELSPYIKYQHDLGLTAWVASVISHLVIFGQDVVMFLGLNLKTGTLFFTNNFHKIDHPFWLFLLIPQAWSLGLELTFYLIAPFIVNKNIKLILGLIVASMLLRIYIFHGLKLAWDPWTYRFFPTELIFFLLGNISYRIYRRIKDQYQYSKMSPLIAFVFFLTILIYPNVHIPIQERFVFLIFFCSVFLSLPFIFILTKNSKHDNRIGELSYPIYLIHFLVIHLVGSTFRSHNSNNFKAFLIISLSVLVAFILLKLIIDPIDKLRQSRFAKQVKS